MNKKFHSYKLKATVVEIVTDEIEACLAKSTMENHKDDDKKFDDVNLSV